MPTFHIARDGHYFIRNGYPWASAESGGIYTYQLYPTGDQVFDLLGWKGGEHVAEALFYSLLVDGSLYHESLRAPVPIMAIPSAARSSAFSIGTSHDEPLKKLYLEFAKRPRDSLSRVMDAVISLTGTQEKIISKSTSIYLASKIEAHQSSRFGII